MTCIREDIVARAANPMSITKLSPSSAVVKTSSLFEVTNHIVDSEAIESLNDLRITRVRVINCQVDVKVVSEDYRKVGVPVSKLYKIMAYFSSRCIRTKVHASNQPPSSTSDELKTRHVRAIYPETFNGETRLLFPDDCQSALMCRSGRCGDNFISIREARIDIIRNFCLSQYSNIDVHY
jgi:hypothetical protein